MATIFYVHCPACDGKFPCHSELWGVEYDLLCPFCGTSFPQEASPMIISAIGERRPGRSFGLPSAGAAPPPAPDPAPGRPPEIDPDATAESM